MDDHCKRFHPPHPFWNDQAARSSSIHYGQIVITEAVHREVVTEGIALGKADANLFGKGDWGLG